MATDNRAALKLSDGFWYNRGLADIVRLPPSRSFPTDMASRTVLLASIAVLFGGSFFLRDRLPEPTAILATKAEAPQRIISSSPAITEMLFALGLGERVVGVSEFCKYPPEAKSKPKIGGFFDPNYETIASLKPDLVVVLKDNYHAFAGFEKLGVRTIAADVLTLDAILQSIRKVGRACGEESRGVALATDIENRLERLRRKTADSPRPRTLFVIERTLGARRIADVHVASKDGFFDKIATAAGGATVSCEGPVSFPLVSSEGILKLNPEVIIDLSPGLNQSGLSKEEMLADWETLSTVDAVKNGRVYLFDADYATVPGPRFILLAEDLARVLHPELDWSKP